MPVLLPPHLVKYYVLVCLLLVDVGNNSMTSLCAKHMWGRAKMTLNAFLSVIVVMV